MASISIVKDMGNDPMALSTEKLMIFLDEDAGVDISDVEPGTLLFSTGIVDSFTLASLMSFIETEADIRVNPFDVNLDNMDSIERILAYVDRVKK